MRRTSHRRRRGRTPRPRWWPWRSSWRKAGRRSASGTGPNSAAPRRRSRRIPNCRNWKTRSGLRLWCRNRGGHVGWRASLLQGRLLGLGKYQECIEPASISRRSHLMYIHQSHRTRRPIFWSESERIVNKKKDWNSIQSPLKENILAGLDRDRDDAWCLVGDPKEVHWEWFPRQLLLSWPIYTDRIYGLFPSFLEGVADDASIAPYRFVGPSTLPAVQSKIGGTSVYRKLFRQFQVLKSSNDVRKNWVQLTCILPMSNAKSTKPRIAMIMAKLISPT